MAVKVILNDEQKEAFKAIQKFIEHPAADTFVLKGYAGTGKTFLMQHLAKWLDKNEHPFSLLASTGRAATVLRGKTGFDASTVHGELYKFNRVDGDEEHIPDDAAIQQFGQMTLLFFLRPPDDSKKIYIVDESSMLSSEISSDATTVSFGSGYLLSDFFQCVGKNKIIFVGDPGQLPPVGQTFSPALDMDWLANQHRIAVSVTLEKIERHDPGNDILILASNIRNMSMDNKQEKFPKFPAKNLNNVKLHHSTKVLFDEYVKRYKEVGVSGTLAIARSNKMVHNLNRALRRDLFGQLDLPIQTNDVLMVVQNNYSVPLTNGDFVVVTSIGEPRLQSNLSFLSVRIKAITSENEYEILLSIDILYSKEPNFKHEQSRALMIDFSKRMRQKKIKPNSEAYKKAMMEDSYLNCLKAKYGYAVTCHKAQGGEWNDVYLFLEKSMYAMKREEMYRWWYTAVTRAREKLYLTNDWWIV